MGYPGHPTCRDEHAASPRDGCARPPPSLTRGRSAQGAALSARDPSPSAERRRRAGERGFPSLPGGSEPPPQVVPHHHPRAGAAAPPPPGRFPAPRTAKPRCRIPPPNPGDAAAAESRGSGPSSAGITPPPSLHPEGGRRCPGLQTLGLGRRDGGNGSLRGRSAAADGGGGGAAATASGPGSALGGLGPDPARPLPGNALFSRAAQPGGGEAGRRIITPRCNPQSWPNPKAQVPVSKTSGKVIETDKYGVTNNQ